jgi:hypothetical protein
MKVRAKLHKQHSILSIHIVRECIRLDSISSHEILNPNPAEIISKSCGTRVKALWETQMIIISKELPHFK